MQSVDIQTLLKKAEALCLSRSVRMTSQRKSILQLIAGQPGAISAYELLDLLRETAGKTADNLPRSGISAGAGIYPQN